MANTIGTITFSPTQPGAGALPVHIGTMLSWDKGESEVDELALCARKAAMALWVAQLMRVYMLDRTWWHFWTTPTRP